MLTAQFPFLSEIGIFDETPFVFHAVRTPMDMLFRIDMLAMIVCSCPIVGGEVAQPPRAMHTAMPRTTVI